LEQEVTGRAGVWVGLTVAFLLSSLAMVQLRCKASGGYYFCGDWPRDGYTREFWPPFILVLAAWGLAARERARRMSASWTEALDDLGQASSPMLGLVLAWVWYGLRGAEFHPWGGCNIPVLCHDTMPFAILVWSGPWVIWGAWRLVRAWKIRAVEAGSGQAP
jgi:hypothetical protein